jgi:hypothetical protein
VIPEVEPGIERGQFNGHLDHILLTDALVDFTKNHLQASAPPPRSSFQVGRQVS